MTMFDFGDELTAESFRIPWLIWIQLVVMFLIILLFYCLSLISLDSTNHPNLNNSSSTYPYYSSSSSTSSIEKSQKVDSKLVTSLSQTTQVSETQSIKCEIKAGSASNRRVLVRRDEMIEEEEEEQEQEEEQVSLGPNVYLHPCSYLRLARTAVLKCLGLDSLSENSSTVRRRKKKDE